MESGTSGGTTALEGVDAITNGASDILLTGGLYAGSERFVV